MTDNTCSAKLGNSPGNKALCWGLFGFEAESKGHGTSVEVPQQFQKKAPHLPSESPPVHTEGTPGNPALSESVPAACELANRNQQCDQAEGRRLHQNAVCSTFLIRYFFFLSPPFSKPVHV